MKRAFAALVGTVVGLIMLLSFKTHATPPSVAAPLSATPPGPPTPQASAPASTAPTGAPTSEQPSATVSAPQVQAPTRNITGSSISTRYGAVQVSVAFAGTRIVDVVPVRLPDSNGVDQEIDQQAVPILIQETLSAQGANIQAVSGATYTSDGYMRSLQSALDKAK
jgi:uncharacterized protein with FMN-binding domain